MTAPLPAREAYRLWAPRYDAENAVTTLEDEAVRALTPPLAGLRLLDAACGTGRRLARYATARQGPAPDRPIAVGVDLVPEMIAEGRRRYAWSGHVAVADVRALPFAAATFQTVWCRLALGHLEDLPIAYAEMARVAAPGARLVVSDFHPAAVRAGHRRTFRDARGRQFEVEHHLHTRENHEAAGAAAGWRLDGCLEPAVGPAVRSFYEAAGAVRRYDADLGLRLVLALAFTR